ncbi:MAG: metallophosphoesterase [Elusimicrobia bacterium]|nr:metallophosphoesterase [Elusimicrobiota bacterium]
MKRSSGKEWAARHPSPEAIFRDMRAEREKRRVRKHEPPLKPPRLILAISDTHRPKFDPATWAIFLAAVRDMKPDAVWIVGDFIDLSSVNRHEKATGDAYTLKMELWDGNRGLDEISDAIGPRRCELTLWDGNHEDRLRRYVASGRCPPELRDMFDEIPAELHLAERGWRYIHPDDQPTYPYPRFAVTHGSWYGLHAAHKHATEFGCSGLMGHTHRYQVHSGVNAGGPFVWTVMPCSRDPKAEWLHQRTQVFTNWQTGFAVIEVVDSTPYVRVVLTHGGKAIYGGQVWRA